MSEPVDLAALGRAQTRGEDIRPPGPDYDPVAWDMWAPPPVDDAPQRQVSAHDLLLTLALIGQLEREARK